MSSFSSQFAGELRAHLAKNQIPISRVVSLLGYSKTHTYRLIRGERDWSINDALKVADWAGIPRESLFAKSESSVA